MWTCLGILAVCYAAVIVIGCFPVDPCVENISDGDGLRKCYYCDNFILDEDGMLLCWECFENWDEPYE